MPQCACLNRGPSMTLRISGESLSSPRTTVEPNETSPINTRASRTASNAMARSLQQGARLSLTIVARCNLGGKCFSSFSFLLLAVFVPLAGDLLGGAERSQRVSPKHFVNVFLA